VRFQCPHCQSIAAIDDSDAGQAVACGHCERVVLVPASRYAPGSVINDFVIQRELGRGGVGTVYLARQLSLDRPVALKILHPEYAADQSFVNDFVREARAAAMLNHPTLVQAYAVGEDEGVFFFAMEYVEGTTLKHLLSHSGRMVTDRAMAIVTEINAALEFAWQQQKLVHRDIKPDNIILTETGRIKLADMGLARRATDIVQGGEEVMGTPQYISPEQLQGLALDNRSDIYSLGATLYHMLTGRFPYLGDNATEIAQKHLTTPLTPPHEVVKDIPEAVSTVVQIMMAKRPQHRYDNSTELARDLALLRAHQPPARALAPDAQKPLAAAPPKPAVKSAVKPGAGRPGAAGTGKKVMLGGGGAAGKTAWRGGAPGPAASQQATAAAPAKPKKKMSAKTMALIFAAAIGVSILFAVVLLVRGIAEKNKTPEQRELEALRKKHPAAAFNAYLAVHQAVVQKAAGAAVLQKAAAFETQFPTSAELGEKVRKLVTPMAEEELTALRQPMVAAETARWQKIGADRREKERLAGVEQSRKQQEEEARIRQQIEDDRRKQQRTQQLADLRRQQDKLRAEAYDLARQGDFAGARSRLASLSESREEEFSAWAKAKQNGYLLAEKASKLIPDASDKLKGIKLSLPGLRGKWTVTSANAYSVTLETNTINKAGDQVKDSRKFTLDELPVTAAITLMDEAWKRNGKKGGDLNLLLGAWLATRPDPDALREARRHLEASAAKAEAQPLLAELQAIAPLILERQFQAATDQFRLLVNEGKTAEAKRLFDSLRRLYPDQFKAAAKELTDLLKEN
jgi:predicted Ser/Thr protein kinase